MLSSVDSRFSGQRRIPLVGSIDGNAGILPLQAKFWARGSFQQIALIVRYFELCEVGDINGSCGGHKMSFMAYQLIYYRCLANAIYLQLIESKN
jgi:hypothetical protein